MVSFFDKKAKNTFSKHSNKIAAQLNVLADIPGVTAEIIKQKMYYYLTNTLKINSGTAEMIADAIKAAINEVLF